MLDEVSRGACSIRVEEPTVAFGDDETRELSSIIALEVSASPEGPWNRRRQTDQPNTIDSEAGRHMRHM